MVAAVTVFGATVAPAGAQGDDDALRRYQKRFLDPQAIEAAAKQPPAPDTHEHHHHHHGTPVRVAGVADTQQAVAAALPLNTGGQWAFLPSFPSTFNAMHMVAGPGGKVLLVAGSGFNQANFEAGTFRTFVWIPATGVRREVPTPEDFFCSGHTLLPDGRALVSGGTSAYPSRGSKALYAFNFTTERYERLTPMEIARWYPTIVKSGDGRALIVSGFDANGQTTTTHEVFDYRTNTHSRVPGTRLFPLYPQIFQAPAAGTYFYSGAAYGWPNVTPPGFWRPFAGNTYQPVPGLAVPAQRAGAASCFIGDGRNQELMVMGGGWPATATTSWIKLNAATPTFRPGPPMPAAKAYMNCLYLPDGAVMQAGGGSANTIAGASTEASMLKSSPLGPWTPLNPMPAGQHRVYHSMMFLLDNGQVVSMTSNPTDGARSTTLLVFSPPYMFRGARPVIMSGPPTITWGGSYPVRFSSAAGSSVPRVTLTTPSSPTHAGDVNQRYINLPVVNGRITIPASREMLPPGRYRMWAIDTSGRPSMAGWLTLG